MGNQAALTAESVPGSRSVTFYQSIWPDSPEQRLRKGYHRSQPEPHFTVAMNSDTSPAVSALVVEDDEHISHLLKFILEREEFVVHLARDGREARQFIEENPPPSIVLLDVMLPFLDGFALVGLLRAQPDWKTVPVIMLTAKTQEKDIVRALDEGANDYIVKPFQPAELLARIKRFSPRK